MYFSLQWYTKGIWMCCFCNWANKESSILNKSVINNAEDGLGYFCGSCYVDDIIDFFFFGYNYSLFSRNSFRSNLCRMHLRPGRHSTLDLLWGYIVGKMLIALGGSCCEVMQIRSTMQIRNLPGILLTSLHSTQSLSPGPCGSVT